MLSRDGERLVVLRAQKVMEEWPTPSSALSDSTRQQYAKEGLRLAKLAYSLRSAATALNEGNPAKRTWVRRKAALIYYVHRRIELRLDRILPKDAIDFGVDPVEAGRLEKDLELLDQLRSLAIPAEVATTRPRKSKRRSLKGLPDNWQEKMWRAVDDDHPHRPLLALLTLVGPRPAELVKGIIWRQIHTPEGIMALAITIPGAKGRGDGLHGQEERTVEVPTASPYAATLLDIPAGRYRFPGSAHAITCWVGRISKRIWPKKTNTVTPYTYRHHFSACAKATLPHDGSVSAALGHRSERTASRYGTRRQSRVNPTTAPLKAYAAAPVIPKQIPLAHEVKVSPLVTGEFHTRYPCP